MKNKKMSPVHWWHLKERCCNWKTASNRVKVLYQRIMFHIHALILHFNTNTPILHALCHFHPPERLTLKPVKMIDVCRGLLSSHHRAMFTDFYLCLRYFFILLCRLGANLGVLTPVMIWQSSLSFLNFWFTSHPFYIVDVLRLLSSGERGS